MNDERMTSWLEHYLDRLGAVAGTVHLQREGHLHLAAAVNIPPKVCEIVTFVPNGKGMAGLALQRGVPVQTCNLKEDESGNVKPGAKAVDAKAAAALPLEDGSGRVHAVVGIAFGDERTLTDEMLASFVAEAADFPT